MADKICKLNTVGYYKFLCWIFFKLRFCSQNYLFFQRPRMYTGNGPKEIGEVNSEFMIYRYYHKTSNLWSALSYAKEDIISMEMLCFSFFVSNHKS